MEPERIVRPRSEALDAVLGQPIKVLDNGFVRPLDYMGSDEAIVAAARVSYGRGTKRLSEDRGLIRYLMRHGHTSPFEMCEIKLHVRVPMDCWRQWLRHRTANVNEYSTRYSEAIDSSQRTPSDQWREQSRSNKQGSGGYLSVEIGQKLSAREAAAQDLAREDYRERLSQGVAREQARKDLPLSTYTEAYWKIDLHNLLHFLSLRMDPRAQEEIRAYANVIGHEIVSRWCPLAWEAFVDYGLKATTFSRLEMELLAALSSGDTERATKLATDYGLLPRGPDGKLLGNRERDELEAKLAQLGIASPWRR
jgi:thymidylate synthase (FAD)